MARLVDASVRYGEKFGLRDFTGSFPAGTVSVLVGGDGAGKSTLLRVLAGRLPLSSGQVLVADVPTAFPAHPAPRPGGPAEGSEPPAGGIGYQGERDGVWPQLSVAENVEFAARVHGLPSSQRRQRAARLLEAADLERFTGRLAGRLSGGMRKKLGFVLATLHRPGLVLLDEPTTGVDATARVELWELLEAAAQEGATVVLATSYLDEAERAGRVFLLGEGRLLASGTPAQVRGQMPGTLWRLPPPASLDVAREADTWRIGRARFLWCAPGRQPGLPGGQAAVRAEPNLENAAIGYLLAAEQVTTSRDDAAPSAPTNTPAPAPRGARGISEEVRAGLRGGAEGGGSETEGQVAGGALEGGGAETDGRRATGGGVEDSGSEGSGGSQVAGGSAGAASAGVLEGGGGNVGSHDEGHELVSASQVRRRYGDFWALDGVDLAVRAGQIVGLVGGNGAGKTTLMRIILGLEHPTGGHVELMGRRPGRAARERIGYVAQGLGLYPTLSARENLEFAASVTGGRLEGAALALAHELGKTPVAQLPLGIRRTLAFHAATLHSPDLLILDEPTSGLDPLGRARLWKELREKAQQGTGILVTTHYVKEAEQCDHLVMLKDGKVVPSPAG
ncbi:MAG: ATP-binding cassette domain-containing protein [Buchananella hordeovulneris]|nr:ATP-binding cassette domain-containing protein [Buchananella hordeovulneris]